MTSSKLQPQDGNYPLHSRAMPSRPIYLDHHATTPMDERVIDAVVRAMRDLFGNPNSVEHSVGQSAAYALDAARISVSTLCGAEPHHVHFLPGASDAIRAALEVALFGLRVPLRVAAMRVEHPAMLDALARLEAVGKIHMTWLINDRFGKLDFKSLIAALDGGLDLLCIMAANNEVGTIYPISDVIKIARERGTEVLVDATQAAGRIRLHESAQDADYIVLSAHKIYGPKGVGALVSGKVTATQLEHVLGHQSTPNVPAIVGFGVAAELAYTELDQDIKHAAILRDRLEAGLRDRIANVVVNGDLANRLPNSLHISIPGVPNDAVLTRISGFLAISTGAACASGAQESSHVLEAMALEPALVEGALRLAPGRFSTSAEIDSAIEIICDAVNDVRNIQNRRQAC